MPDIIRILSINGLSSQEINILYQNLNQDKSYVNGAYATIAKRLPRLMEMMKQQGMNRHDSDFRFLVQAIGKTQPTQDDFAQRETWVRQYNITSYLTITFLLDNMRELRALSPEKVPVYIDISTRIDGSPSREIVRMREVLIAIILESDDPRRAFDAIEDIFIQNNLPTAAKVIKVFDVLNTPKRLEQVLADKTASPVLKNAPFDLARRAIIRRDIFNVAVRSGNRNLRAYLELLDQSSELATAFMNGKRLTPTERAVWNI